MLQIKFYIINAEVEGLGALHRRCSPASPIEFIFFEQRIY